MPRMRTLGAALLEGAASVGLPTAAAAPRVHAELDFGEFLSRQRSFLQVPWPRLRLTVHPGQECVMSQRETDSETYCCPPKIWIRQVCQSDSKSQLGSPFLQVPWPRLRQLGHACALSEILIPSWSPNQSFRHVLSRGDPVQGVCNASAGAWSSSSPAGAVAAAVQGSAMCLHKHAVGPATVSGSPLQPSPCLSSSVPWSNEAWPRSPADMTALGCRARMQRSSRCWPPRSTPSSRP